MPNLFETNQIPDDEAYWDALALRVARRTGAPDSTVLDAMTTRVGWMAASLLFAAGLMLVLRADRDAESREALDSRLTELVSPPDETGRMFVASASVPDLASLLVPPARGSK